MPTELYALTLVTKTRFSGTLAIFVLDFGVVCRDILIAKESAKEPG
jgi:hypothetical protein